MQEDSLHKGAGKKLFELAKDNRNNSTQAERILWEVLRSSRLAGFKFRRQHPISNYIADFYCHQIKLVIEVDGKYHLDKEQKEYDELRTADLSDLGIKVLRVSNKEVENNLSAVKNKILNYLVENHSK